MTNLSTITPEQLQDPQQLLNLFEASSPEETANIIEKYFHDEQSIYYLTLKKHIREKNEFAKICYLLIRKDISFPLNGYFKTDEIKDAINLLPENSFERIKKSLKTMSLFAEYNAKYHREKGWKNNLSSTERTLSVEPDCYANLHCLNITGAILTNQNLSAYDLINSSLHKVELSNCILKNANFYNAALYDTNILNSDMRFSNLRAINCESVYFKNVNLEGADLSYADFSNDGDDENYSTLENVNLIGANLKGMKLGYTTLNNIDFFPATLLEDIPAFKCELTRLHSMLKGNEDIAKFKVAIVEDIAKKAKSLPQSKKDEIYAAAYEHPLLQHRHFGCVKNALNSMYSFFSHHDKAFHRHLVETHSQKVISRKFGF